LIYLRDSAFLLLMDWLYELTGFIVPRHLVYLQVIVNKASISKQ